MQFKDLSDEALQRVGDRIIRNAMARVRRQIPSQSNIPINRRTGPDRLRRTGNLLREFKFQWGKQSNGTWALTADYGDADYYGRFPLYGTGNYEISREPSFFAMRFNGYERGEGGIRPQGYLSLYGDRPVYEAIVEAELNIVWQTFLNNTITGLTRQAST